LVDHYYYNLDNVDRQWTWIDGPSPNQSYLTQRPSLFTPISYCAFSCSNVRWFT